MSNALAIASVTRLLRDLLHDALVDGNVSSALGEDVTVTALPPDRVIEANGGTESSQLNLFLHQVRPNAAWRNVEQPTRNANGVRVGRPLLPLNLHYLLTAYAGDELHAEILLGYAMQLFHENAVLNRRAIRAALTGSAVDGAILPAAFQALRASDVADQVELLKITPETLSTDDMSKLWTALQTHYRTTVAYEVSVVLIESRGPQRSPLPVLTRGTPDPVTGREAGVIVQANLLPPFPTLQAVEPPNQQLALRMGETATLTGHHLGGDVVVARFTEPRSLRTLDVAVEPDATDHRVRVRIPPDPPAAVVPADSPLNPANWRAGLYNLVVVVERAGQPSRVTNELPVLIAPRVESVAMAPSGAGTRFTVGARPPLHETQRISLTLRDRELLAESVDGSTSPPTASFRGTGFASGEKYAYRLRVDGVDSILIDRSVEPPVFDATQELTIP